MPVVTAVKYDDVIVIFHDDGIVFSMRYDRTTGEVSYRELDPVPSGLKDKHLDFPKRNP